MSETTINDQVSNTGPNPENAEEAPLELADLLVEDVSIDGMCGVY